MEPESNAYETEQSAQPGFVSRMLLWMLDFYQKGISPLLPPSCRFEPTCSNYAIEAVRTRGPLVGVLLATWRLLKCAPWHPGGWDPVPAPRNRRSKGSDAGSREPPEEAGGSRQPVDEPPPAPTSPVH